MHPTFIADVPVKFNFYDLKATTTAGLKTEMEESGPVDLLGRHRFALTEWNVTWDWAKKNGIEDFSNPKISATIKISLPRWTSSTAAPSELKTQWIKFYSKLLQHELNHARSFVSVSSKLREKLIEYADSAQAPNEKDASKVAQEWMAKARDLDHAYDQKSEHGKLEGVALN